MTEPRPAMTTLEIAHGGGGHSPQPTSTPTPSSQPAFKRLSEAEARRALYIDFEGEKDKPPVLLGVLRHRGRGAEPYVLQVVVDSDFEPAGPSVRGFREAVEIVVLRAEHGDRRIVSWSQHDLEVVRRLRGDDPELVARFEWADTPTPWALRSCGRTGSIPERSRGTGSWSATLR